MQPLHSGWRTNALDMFRPRNFISAMKSLESYWEPWSLRSLRAVSLHTSFSTVTKRFLTAALTGSIASYRVPRLQVCHDINSSLKWSRTPKNQHQPMSSTKNFLPSVPHNRSGFPWTIVPSCLRAFTVALSWRYGLSDSFSRMIRRSLSLLAILPFRRIRTHTLMYPSLTNGDSAIAERIALSVSSSVKRGLGPRFCGGTVAFLPYQFPLEHPTTRRTILMGYFAPVFAYTSSDRMDTNFFLVSQPRRSFFLQGPAPSPTDQSCALPAPVWTLQGSS